MICNKNTSLGPLYSAILVTTCHAVELLHSFCLHVHIGKTGERVLKPLPSPQPENTLASLQVPATPGCPSCCLCSVYVKVTSHYPWLDPSPAPKDKSAPLGPGPLSTGTPEPLAWDCSLPGDWSAGWPPEATQEILFLDS